MAFSITHSGFSVRRALLSGFLLLGVAAATTGRPAAAQYGAGLAEERAAAACLTASAGSWQYAPLSAPQTGAFAVEADMTPPTATTSGAFAVASGTPASGAWSGLAAIVLFDDTSGTIKARDFDRYVDAPTPLRFQAGATYRVRMEINVAARTYAASVTPAGGARVVIGSGLRFRETQAAVTSLSQMAVVAGTNSSITGCNLAQATNPPPSTDGFGTANVFQTTAQGREWHMNAAGPTSDPLLKVSNGSVSWDSAAGGWRVNPNDGKIRMNVITPKNSSGAFTAAPWLNVEMTGYFRVVAVSDDEDELTFYTRGGQHNDSRPCEGTAYKGSGEFQGGVYVQKELFHGQSGAGYTDNPQKRGVRQFWGGFLGLQRWVGMKVIVYNTTVDGKPAVQTEVWLDTAGANAWQRATLAVDIQSGTANGFPTGDWTTNDTVPSACGWNRGYVIRTGTTPGRESWATFRTDNAALLFSKLSIREIDPQRRLIQP